MTYAWDNDSTQNAHIKQMRDDRQKAYMEKHRDNKAYERFKHMPDYGKGAVMERLTNRDYGENSCAVYTSYCDACHNSDCHCGLVEDMIEKLADYEDLEEQGKLIKIPLEAYCIVDFKVRKGFVLEETYHMDRKPLLVVRYDDNSLTSHCGYLGISVFLTKSEAEAKLKELRGGEDEERS